MEDCQIVQLYWNRDERAISVTSEQYGAYCTAIARNILGSPEDVEECVNDTYWSAWNAMPPHRPSRLSVFLGRLTRNLAFNRWNHNRAEKRGGGEIAAVLDELSQLVSGRDDAEQEVNYRELVQAIDGFLTALSPKKRCLFIRRYWYTDSVSDLAARLGMREGAVSMALNRLRRDLRRYLSERGFTL